MRLVCQTKCPPASSRAQHDLAYVAAGGSCAPFLVYSGMLAGPAAWCEALGPGLQWTPWDTLLVRMVWQWIGHVVCMPPSSLTRPVLLDLRPSSGQRRSRTGPDWEDLENSWLRHNGVPLVPKSHANIFPLPGDKCMWTRRCLQGLCLRHDSSP